MSVTPGACFVCRRELEEGDNTVIVVRKGGIQSLITASVERGLKDNEKFLKNLNEVRVHDACRKRYTARHNVDASARRGGDEIPKPQPSTSRTSGPMNLQSICFLCAEEITEDFIQFQKKLPMSRRNEVHTIESMTARASMIDAASRRGDEWGRQIIDRLAPTSDLVAADARYHKLCHKKLYSIPFAVREKKYLEPKNVADCMEHIYSYLHDNREECQFSVNELIDQINGEYKPDIRTVKTHLLSHFGDKITFAEIGRGRSHQVVMCFTGVGRKILYDNWYNERKRNPEEERMRVVSSATEIMLQDIRSKAYDTTAYPPSDDFLQETESVVPKSLQLLIETIVLKHKHQSLEIYKKKCVSIAHAIISATRNRSFLSSIKIGLGAYLYRKFGSKHLVNICAAMGFSCSYDEALLVESSAIVQGEGTPPIEKGAFVQFVSDNADVNVDTLDGNNTFHEMGGIMIISPKTAVLPDKAIPRLKKLISADNIGSFFVSEIQQCSVRKNSGLSSIPIIDVNEGFQVAGDILPTAPELLWLFGKTANSPDIPGWNGFMEQVTDGLDFHTSKIVFLPFIHAPPTDYDTVLTSLLDAAARTAAHGQHTCFVTYD